MQKHTPFSNLHNSFQIRQYLFEFILVSIFQKIDDLATVLILVPLLHLESLCFRGCLNIRLHRVIVTMPSTLHHYLGRNAHSQ